MNGVTREEGFKPWVGLFGGFVCWYAAHDLGFYFSDLNCRYHWIAPSIHLVTWFASLACAFFAFHVWSASGRLAEDDRPAFISGISFAAGSLFSLVILWQGIAAFLFNGCER